jgi:hypothetical protein
MSARAKKSSKADVKTGCFWRWQREDLAESLLNFDPARA